MSHLLQHPDKKKLEKYKGRLNQQIKAFTEGLAANRLPDKVLLIMDEPYRVLHGSETFASLSRSDGAVHFIVEARSLIHVVHGFRYWYEVDIQTDGAITVQVFRAPDDRVKTPSVPPTPDENSLF